MRQFDGSGETGLRMLADLYRDGVRASTLRKLLRLLDNYAKTPAGEVVYGHVEQMLHAFENEQMEKEQALCGMIRMVLDAFSTHLDPDSGLYAHISILQTRLTPPLSLAELNALNDYMEFTSDEITQFELTSPQAISQAMQPLFKAFEKRDSASQSAQSDDRRRNDRRRHDARRSADNVHYLSGHGLHRDIAVGDDESAETLLAVDANMPLQQEISESMAQSEEFSTLLEIELATLRQLDNISDFDEKKRAVTRELETVLQRHRQLTGKFDKVNDYLGQVLVDSNRLNEELHRVTKLSLTDELTGLPNRRAFISRLHEEVSRVQRYGHELAIALLDLDYFKMINDTYGHPAGDRVLQEYAGSVLSRLREHDMVARYGGEEFAIIFPSTENEGAQAALENIRRAGSGLECHVEGQAIPLPTFSCGLAIYNPGESMDSLIKRADQALYQAKKNGRNCVVVGEQRDN